MADVIDEQTQFASHQALHQAMEDARREHEANMDRRRTKLELLRMAKETLVENARNKPVEEAGITAAEIAAFAEELTQYVGD